METPSETIVRRRIIYHGRVQGVGFRYTTLSIARRFPATGYVKNLRDGTVEVVVHAAPADIQGFLNAVSRTFEGYITDQQDSDDLSAETFDRFEIRY